MIFREVGANARKKNGKMQICDGKGNLSSDFLERLEELKREQGENMRELERLKIDAFIEGRNAQIQESNQVSPLQLDKVRLIYFTINYSKNQRNLII